MCENVNVCVRVCVCACVCACVYVRERALVQQHAQRRRTCMGFTQRPPSVGMQGMSCSGDAGHELHSQWGCRA